MHDALPALVVGCGAIGSGYDRERSKAAFPRSHAGAYAASPHTTLVGGVDPDPLARDRFVELWGVPCYPSLTEAFADCDPALVSICTPPHSRLDLVTMLLQPALRALWVEKPLADTVTAGEQLVERCAQSGVALQVNFSRRFDERHQRVAAEVRGRVLHADFRFSGSLENYGSHAIDLFRWFVGEPLVVQAAANGRNGDPFVVLRTADDRTGILGRVVRSTGPLFDVDLWLEERRYTLTSLGEQLLVAKPVVTGPGPMHGRLRFDDAAQPGVGLEETMARALAALLANLEAGTELPCTGSDGLAELRIREAVGLALSTGGPIMLGSTRVAG